MKKLDYSIEETLKIIDQYIDASAKRLQRRLTQAWRKQKAKQIV